MATNLQGGVIFWNRAAETLYGWTAAEVLGRDIVALSIGPAFIKPERAQMARLRRGESWSGESTARRHDGTTFIAHVLHSPILDRQGRLIGIAGMVSDVHESQRHSAALAQRMDERTSKLRQSEATIRTLFRISSKLNATLDIGRLMDDLAQEAIQIVHGESGFAGLRTADGMTVHKYFRQAQAIPFEYTWPAGSDIPGWVLEHKMPYGTSEAANDPVMRRDLAINAGVRSVICTPILDSVGEVLGFFNICNKTDGAGFTLSDQEMLMALSPAASIAIQNALAYERRLQAETELKQSYAQLRELAAKLEAVREEERTGLARELHDQLGQALTALKLDLARLTDRLVDTDTTLAGEARAITTQMDTLVKSVRRIATELRPGLLDTLGLAASIEWQAREFQNRTGVRCVVNVPAEDLSLARAPSSALFRIFQETLTNVARHAEAQHVSVELKAAKGWLTLRVHDDGRGMQASEFKARRSLGLLGMRERAELLGGTFNIRGAPGQGTTVTVSIPFTQKDSDQPGA